ncbi:MAG: hypothetical protein KKC18_07480 [Chloroflexi bacterium]|nr:hypothetical protein [Chloroflexota bacterium]
MKRTVKIEGTPVKGTVVDATVLSDLLSLTIDGAQMALRLRTQGRSTARGVLPKWIQLATKYDVEIKAGSTVLELTGPTLAEADPEEFGQRDMFPELDPDLTAIDYLGAALDSTLANGSASTNDYDRGMIDHIRKYGSLFEAGVTSLTYSIPVSGSERSVTISPLEVKAVENLSTQIPPSQQVRVAGKLDSIRHSDTTFGLLVPGSSETVRGIATQKLLESMQRLWTQDVLVTGTAHFASSGKLLRVEAQSLREARDQDLGVFGEKPIPLGRPDDGYSELRVVQGARTGLNAIVGKWPGDEDDAEVESALAEIS